jgi:beta-lactamase class A
MQLQTPADVVSRVNEIAAETGGEWSVCYIRKDTGEHLSINGNQVMSSASVIKLAIIVEVYRQALYGKLRMDQEVELLDKVKVPGSGVLRGLHGGLKLTIKDLATLMITVSDNTATNILIDIVGIDGVNNLLRSLGLKNTILARKMYDWEARKAGRDNVCTADDIANLLVQIARGEALPPPQSQEIIDILSLQMFTHKIPLLLPEDVRVANKTGEVDDVTHDAALIFADGLTYSICVMSRGVPGKMAACTGIARISKAVYDYLSTLPESYL